MISSQKMFRVAYGCGTSNSTTFCSGVAPGVSDGGLTLPTKRLKYCFQGTINAKNLRENRFSSSDGGG